MKQCEGAPREREKMVDRKELIEGRGKEGELIEVDDKNNPHIGCRRLRDDEYEVKHCEGTML
jgi:hypothetical protein